MMLKVSKEAHRKIKFFAFMRGLTIAEVAEKAILQFIEAEEKKNKPQEDSLV